MNATASARVIPRPMHTRRKAIKVGQMSIIQNNKIDNLCQFLS
jgi:hypothetical protein